MGMYVANEVVKLMVKNDLKISGAKVLVLGVTFKEKLLKNTKVIDVITQLQDFGTQVTVYDPWAKTEEVHHEYGITSQRNCVQFDAIVLTVAQISS